MAFALAAPPGWALSTDRDKPIEIEADSAERDDAKGITIYRGDVIIVQGTLRITGAKVTIHADENGDFEKMITLGKPARFRQLPDGEEDQEKNYQTARASRMEYFKERDLIVLLGSAVYGQGGDRVAADRIEYDSRNARMVAKSVKAKKDPKVEQPGKTKRNRVRITIQPKKN
jgi:lipopolysaccharide export system protein LptA